MNFLLDTNVVSEWIKPRPDANVVRWLAHADEDRVFLSVASIAEIRRGIELLPAGSRRESLEHWLADDLSQRFEQRIITVTIPVAHAWGTLMARAQQGGFGLGSMDAFIAATALIQNLTLVTRNVRDYARLGIELLNPWTSSE
jgi:toxin FitB